MNTKHQDLRGQLLRQRRDRLGRNGTLGPSIKALHDLATLMELDTLSIYRHGKRPVDFELITRACYGPLISWNRASGRYDIKPLHTHRAERQSAEALIQAVVDALGAEFGPSIGEVRAVADRLAVDAMARQAGTSA